MMRGPSYDDAYISRKMSHLHGPTFSAPGPVSYGRPPIGGYMQEPYGYDYVPRGYPPLGPPPPRMVPRMPPAYYDYDYSYGGYYGYAPPPPRISRYDSYLDDDLQEPTYIPRYRPRVPDTLDDADFRERAPAAPSAARAVTTADGDDSMALVPARGRTVSRLRPHLQSIPRQEVVPGETEGERHLARLAHRYPSLSEPQMLQDHVDKMRIRLKSLAYSLDPTGPVPEIILPERHKKSGALDDKKYSSALEFKELPKLASRRQRYYPEDEHMKDNLRIQCLSHYKTTRTAADAQVRGVMPDTTSRYTKLTSKWEEPDTVFGAPTDKKPFSKAITDGTTEEGSEERKERRKKKKSKERDFAPETSAAETPAPADHSEVEPVSAPTESEPAAANGEPGAEDDVLDDKERKRLEKKKRKAEREAAAKAAMEAELAALAAAEAELARLEAESSSLKPDAPAPVVSAPAEVAPAPAEPAAEVKSESAAEK